MNKGSKLCMQVRRSIFSLHMFDHERFDSIKSFDSKMQLFYFLNLTLVAANLMSAFEKHKESVKMAGLGFCENEGQKFPTIQF